MDFVIPALPKRRFVSEDKVWLIANGDGRTVANQMGWPAQQEMETKLAAAFAKEGIEVVRAHEFRPEVGHGFIDSQRYGMDVFSTIDPEAKIMVAISVWQFSHHVLAGLRSHKGPILTVANWSGQAPGLVGLLNLNGGLTKMGVKYSSLWSEDFEDDFFMRGIHQFVGTGKIRHDGSHARQFRPESMNQDLRSVGEQLATYVQRRKAIFGVFDEGCMGMYNAILDDELLNPTGVYKERLSQAELYAEMQKVGDAEARKCYEWLLERGMKFDFGIDPATELIEDHVIDQCKMYIAAVRIADRFNCDAIGIQYQLGLANLTSASDLAEGMLNNPDRPPVFHAESGAELYAGRALPHFNEVDECAGLDAYVNNVVWTSLGLDPSTTLHDVRYGEKFGDEFVWVFLISGAAPASHFEGGYAGASSERQPPQYFRHGGGSMKGVSREGVIVWSRIYVAEGILQADMGIGFARSLPAEETQRRWSITTPAWPIMHAVLPGITRDQMMARHKSNHIQVVYAPDVAKAKEALDIKAAMLSAMGVRVHYCGDV